MAHIKHGHHRIIPVGYFGLYHFAVYVDQVDAGVFTDQACYMNIELVLNRVGVEVYLKVMLAFNGQEYYVE